MAEFQKDYISGKFIRVRHVGKGDSLSKAMLKQRGKSNGQTKRYVAMRVRDTD